jgi:hypothetical protein
MPKEILGEQNPTLEKYKKMRDIGMDLSQSIPDAYGLTEAMPKLIRVFELKQGNTAMLDSEEELNFLVDYYLHEYQENGKTPLERYRGDHPEADELVVEYLDASKQSYTSLFKVIDCNPAMATLTLRDLLNKDSTVTVLNVNLSRSAKSDYLIFSRLIPFENCNAFSGMFAIFPPKEEWGVLMRYRDMKKQVKSKQESVQRIVAMFKLNRILGVETRTRMI